MALHQEHMRELYAEEISLLNRFREGDRVEAVSKTPLLQVGMQLLTTFENESWGDVGHLNHMLGFFVQQKEVPGFPADGLTAKVLLGRILSWVLSRMINFFTNIHQDLGSQLLETLFVYLI